jgi:hypothetical protein
MRSSRTARAVSLACLAAIGAMSLACPGPAPEETSTDLFRVAVNGAPGGSLLAVWGDPNGRRALLVGGFVGVAPERLGSNPAGRLMEYRDGAFVTRCTTDQVLWWIDGRTDEGVTTVYAVGEGGRVLRYDGRNCATVDTGLTFAEGPVTWWGVLVRGANDVWAVGGSAQPTGPRGVVAHFDGTSWRRITDVPGRARDENLYKITRINDDEMLIVGAGAVALRASAAGLREVPVTARASDNRLFTASCRDDGTCFAVGGAASGLMLVGQPLGDAGLYAAPLGDELSGLNGVWVQDRDNTFAVGVNGTNLHTTGLSRFVGRASTPATLHGVGGWSTPLGTVVMAVGGELGEPTTSQRAVVLVRDSNSRATYTFDGRAFTAEGELRRSLGGRGQ